MTTKIDIDRYLLKHDSQAQQIAPSPIALSTKNQGIALDLPDIPLGEQALLQWSNLNYFIPQRRPDNK